MDQETKNKVVGVGDTVKAVGDFVGSIFAPAKIVTETAGRLWDALKPTLKPEMATPEKKAEVEAILTPALLEHQAKMEVLFNDQMRIKADVIKAEIMSSDKFISHTRPHIQRLSMYFLIFCYGIMPLISYIKESQFKTISLPAELIIGLLGLMGWYVWNRTKEKMNGNGK